MFFELFSLKIKLCICIKVQNLNGWISWHLHVSKQYWLQCGEWRCFGRNRETLFMFLHEQSSLWHLKASAKWSCCRAISCWDDSCCLPTHITCLDMLEWQTLPFSHCHNCSEPSSAGNPFQRREGGSLAESTVLFMKRQLIENRLQMVWQQWCTEERRGMGR